MTNYNTIYREGKRLILDDNGYNYLIHLEQKINKAVSHLERGVPLIKELNEELNTYKTKLNTVKDLVMNSDKYSDGDFEGCVFQNDILDILGGDINDR